jgi:ABC-type sugar transport system ATPase subunit
VGGGIGPIDLNVDAGEVIGIFGLVGSGRTELLETLFGARQASAGTVELHGRRLKLHRPPDAVGAGIALVPSDRLRKGMFPTRQASENVLLRGFAQFASLGVWRRRRRERSAFVEVARALNLDPPRPELEARRFSGGNQQKLVLGRWLRARDRCNVLLLDEPTQGVDVGARRELYEAIRSFSGSGCGVLMASSEPEELMEVADSVVVLSHGRAVGRLQRDEMSETRMLELAHAVEERYDSQMARAGSEGRADDEDPA